MNNILSMLNVLLKTAHEWEVIDRRPCAIKVVRTTMTEATFHSFEAFESLVQAARETGGVAYLLVLLGGEAGLRCGEMMALEWKDLDLTKVRLCVARSEWKGHVTVPKGGRVRHVPLSSLLAEALRSARHPRHARVLLDHDDQPLTQKVVQGIMRRVARRAKVQKGVHILRHTFCSHFGHAGRTLARHSGTPRAIGTWARPSGTCISARPRWRRPSGCWSAAKGAVVELMGRRRELRAETPEIPRKSGGGGGS